MPAITPTRIVFAVIALVVIYFGATAVSNATDHYSLDREREALQREIAEYQVQYDQLQGIRDYLATDEYIETTARRELGLVMPGEPSVIVISPPRESAEDADGTWWQRSFIH
ncbi:MAG TPA: septum formation initiator family protein [Dehalococcoidia bacterium]|nr:septum formation initiator family protein [Dehalococcoidia bacterium]